jgi:hypothetical protein
MKNFTDDEMNALLPTAKAYSVVIPMQARTLPTRHRRSSGSTAGVTSGYATTA